MTGKIGESSERDTVKVLASSFRAAQRVGLGPLRHVAVTGSTNDVLAVEARQGVTYACVLVADTQTAGRGRLGRYWRDAGTLDETPGSLLVSFRMPVAVADAPCRVAAVSAAALSAVSSTGVVVLSKWPNDLVVEYPQISGKLAGVLAEMVDRPHPPVVVIGLGLNLHAVPNEPGAVSLSEIGVNITRDELLSRLLDFLPGYIADSTKSRNVLRSASNVIGRKIRIEYVNGDTITARARDIDMQGRLIVDTNTEQPQIIEASDIHHIRPNQ